MGNRGKKAIKLPPPILLFKSRTRQKRPQLFHGYLIRNSLVQSARFSVVLQVSSNIMQAEFTYKIILHDLSNSCLNCYIYLHLLFTCGNRSVLLIKCSGFIVKVLIPFLYAAFLKRFKYLKSFSPRSIIRTQAGCLFVTCP